MYEGGGGGGSWGVFVKVRRVFKERGTKKGAGDVMEENISSIVLGLSR